MAALALLEAVFGVVYFLAWSATFYPQVLLIFRRKTTAGLSTDFAIINVAGFISYLIFTFSSYALPAVSAAYLAHTGYAPQVDDADVLFAAHGAVMCCVLVAQLFYFPPRTLPHRAVLLPTCAVMAAVLAGLAACLLGRLDWYFFLRVAGMAKVVASIVKHFPQVFLIRSRRSTIGWSFTMILLDVVGGSFSVAQQVVRCLRVGSLAPFTSNYAKTFLAAESLAFDFYFITQHAVWFTDRYDFDVAALGGNGKGGDDGNTADQRHTALEANEESALI